MVSARTPAFVLTIALTLAIPLICAPSSAFGHAVLRGTEPATGATLHHRPEQITFRFSEPVEASFGAIRIYDVDAYYATIEVPIK